MSSINDDLEGLRKRILEIERELSAYGFDRKRGVETYKVSEIKKILSKVPPKNIESVRERLMKLVEIQRIFYRELYRRAGVTEISVDTEMPEKNLEEIERWLGGDQAKKESSSKFSRVVMDVLGALSRDKGIETAVRILARDYKRDYDRYRVLDFLSSLCEDLGASVKKPLPGRFEKAVSVVAALVLDLGAEKVRRLAAARLGL